MPKLFYLLAAALLGLAAYQLLTEGASGPMWACVSSGLMCVTVATAIQQK